MKKRIRGMRDGLERSLICDSLESLSETYDMRRARVIMLLQSYQQFSLFSTSFLHIYPSSRKNFFALIFPSRYIANKPLHITTKNSKR